MNSRSPTRFIVRHPLTFVGRIVGQFQTNRGTLLAGAMAYFALLSLIPLLILLLVTLSHIMDEAQLLNTLHHYLEHLVLGESEWMLEQVAQFFQHRRALSWMMGGSLLLFSAAAFGVLQNAISVIFAHRQADHARSTLAMLLLPYLYVLLLGLGLLVVTLVNGMLQTLVVGDLRWFIWRWSPYDLLVVLLYGIGLLSQVSVFALIYMLMPAGRLPWRHALIGGAAATLLWEAVRYGLVWYFANLSTVNVIYGSLAGVIIALTTLYAISLIILLGAQVIAEYERLTLELGGDHDATETI